LFNFPFWPRVVDYVGYTSDFNVTFVMHYRIVSCFTVYLLIIL